MEANSLQIINATRCKAFYGKSIENVAFESKFT